MKKICAVFVFFGFLIFGPCVFADPAIPATDLAWYREIQDIRGINLNHLDADSHGDAGETLSTRFINDPSFLANLNAMGWNFFRLPVVWSRFAGPGNVLDEVRLQTAIDTVFADLVEKLRTMHTARPELGRIVLDLDFHQYTFGADCGGEGVPLGILTPENNPQDGNCIFREFDRFWKDENGVQEKWVGFLVEVLKRTMLFSEKNLDWLTIAIEPMNEPFPGDATGPFVSNPLGAVFRYLKLYGTQNKQSEDYLIPFYQKALSGVEDHFSSEFSERQLFLFEPYILDFLNLRLFGGTLLKGAHYSTAKSLLNFPKSGRPATWIAAPHFYGAGKDPDLQNALPKQIVQITATYPNAIYNRKQVLRRASYMATVFRNVGMETFFGEVGTYDDLLGKHGSKNGYAEYIDDLKEGARLYTRGFAWWRYSVDESAEQDTYYLLYGSKAGTHAPTTDTDQRLKCDTDHDLAKIVFDACPAFLSE